MRAGKLDRRITILRNFPTRDNMGGDIDDWQELATVWAAKEHVRDGERFRAAEVGATITHRFTIRWSPTVADADPRDRVRFERRDHDILAVKEIGRREGLEITAAARAETPAA